MEQEAKQLGSPATPGLSDPAGISANDSSEQTKLELEHLELQADIPPGSHNDDDNDNHISADTMPVQVPVSGMDSPYSAPLRENAETRPEMAHFDRPAAQQHHGGSVNEDQDLDDALVEILGHPSDQKPNKEPEVFDRLYRNEKRAETVWKEPPKYDFSKSPARGDNPNQEEEVIPEIFYQLHHNERRSRCVWHEPARFDRSKSPVRTTQSRIHTEPIPPIFQQLHNNEKRSETVWQEPARFDRSKSPARLSSGTNDNNEPIPAIFEHLHNNEKRSEAVWQDPARFEHSRHSAVDGNNNNNNNNNNSGQPPIPAIFEQLHNNEKRPENLWQDPARFDPSMVRPGHAANSSSSAHAAEPIPAIFEQLHNNEKRSEAVWQEPARFDPTTTRHAAANEPIPPIFDRLYHNEMRPADGHPQHQQQHEPSSQPNDFVRSSASGSQQTEMERGQGHAVEGTERAQPADDAAGGQRLVRQQLVEERANNGVDMNEATETAHEEVVLAEATRTVEHTISPEDNDGEYTSQTVQLNDRPAGEIQDHRSMDDNPIVDYAPDREHEHNVGGNDRIDATGDDALKAERDALALPVSEGTEESQRFDDIDNAQRVAGEAQIIEEKSQKEQLEPQNLPEDEPSLVAGNFDVVDGRRQTESADQQFTTGSRATGDAVEVNAAGSHAGIGNGDHNGVENSADGSLDQARFLSGPEGDRSIDDHPYGDASGLVADQINSSLVANHTPPASTQPTEATSFAEHGAVDDTFSGPQTDAGNEAVPLSGPFITENQDQSSSDSPKKSTEEHTADNSDLGFQQKSVEPDDESPDQLGTLGASTHKSISATVSGEPDEHGMDELDNDVSAVGPTDPLAAVPAEAEKEAALGVSSDSYQDESLPLTAEPLTMGGFVEHGLQPGQNQDDCEQGAPVSQHSEADFVAEANDVRKPVPAEAEGAIDPAEAPAELVGSPYPEPQAGVLSVAPGVDESGAEEMGQPKEDIIAEFNDAGDAYLPLETSLSEAQQLDGNSDSSQGRHVEVPCSDTDFATTTIAMEEDTADDAGSMTRASLPLSGSAGENAGVAEGIVELPIDEGSVRDEEEASSANVQTDDKSDTNDKEPEAERSPVNAVVEESTQHSTKSYPEEAVEGSDGGNASDEGDAMNIAADVSSPSSGSLPIRGRDDGDFSSTLPVQSTELSETGNHSESLNVVGADSSREGNSSIPVQSSAVEIIDGVQEHVSTAQVLSSDAATDEDMHIHAAATTLASEDVQEDTAAILSPEADSERDIPENTGTSQISSGALEEEDNQQEAAFVDSLEAPLDEEIEGESPGPALLLSEGASEGDPSEDVDAVDRLEGTEEEAMTDEYAGGVRSTQAASDGLDMPIDVMTTLKVATDEDTQRDAVELSSGARSDGLDMQGHGDEEAAVVLSMEHSSDGGMQGGTAAVLATEAASQDVPGEDAVAVVSSEGDMAADAVAARTFESAMEEDMQSGSAAILSSEAAAGEEMNLENSAAPVLSSDPSLGGDVLLESAQAGAVASHAPFVDEEDSAEADVAAEGALEDGTQEEGGQAKMMLTSESISEGHREGEIAGDAVLPLTTFSEDNMQQQSAEDAGLSTEAAIEVTALAAMSSVALSEIDKQGYRAPADAFSREAPPEEEMVESASAAGMPSEDHSNDFLHGDRATPAVVVPDNVSENDVLVEGGVVEAPASELELQVEENMQLANSGAAAPSTFPPSDEAVPPESDAAGVRASAGLPEEVMERDATGVVSEEETERDSSAAQVRTPEPVAIESLPGYSATSQRASEREIQGDSAGAAINKDEDGEMDEMEDPVQDGEVVSDGAALGFVSEEGGAPVVDTVEESIAKVSNADDGGDVTRSLAMVDSSPANSGGSVQEPLIESSNAGGLDESNVGGDHVADSVTRESDASAIQTEQERMVANAPDDAVREDELSAEAQMELVEGGDGEPESLDILADSVTREPDGFAIQTEEERMLTVQDGLVHEGELSAGAHMELVEAGDGEPEFLDSQMELVEGGEGEPEFLDSQQMVHEIAVAETPAPSPTLVPSDAAVAATSVAIIANTSRSSTEVENPGIGGTSDVGLRNSGEAAEDAAPQNDTPRTDSFQSAESPVEVTYFQENVSAIDVGASAKEEEFQDTVQSFSESPGTSHQPEGGEQRQQKPSTVIPHPESEVAIKDVSSGSYTPALAAMASIALATPEIPAGMEAAAAASSANQIAGAAQEQLTQADGPTGESTVRPEAKEQGNATKAPVRSHDNILDELPNEQKQSALSHWPDGRNDKIQPSLDRQSQSLASMKATKATKSIDAAKADRTEGEVSMVASLAPSGSVRSQPEGATEGGQIESKSSALTVAGKFGAPALRQTPNTAYRRGSATDAVTSQGTSNDAPPSPKNEFQKVQLRRRSNKTSVERYIKEGQLEFAELVANALTGRRKSNNDSSLEALRHIDDLKQEVADLQEEEDATLWAINKLRKELLDMFNQGSPMQEEYLLKWIMPLHRERDPKTGRLIMNADQVALMQSFTTSEELSMVAGLGMVRSVLQSNFKAMNGTKCLQDIHDYAQFRLGKKAKRAPQNPWDLLADLFETAQKDETTPDIHQRVCNALVQWVVREILGSTDDTVSSRSCFHAIFLIASLKLELQRLAPAALEQGPQAKMIDADDDRSLIEIQPAKKPAASPRNPYVERLLQSDAFKEDAGPSSPLRYKDSGEVIREDPNNGGVAEEASSSEALVVASPGGGATNNDEATGNDGGADQMDDKEKAMKEAMLVRDASVKEMKSREQQTQVKEERIPESELPEAVQDSHRVIRTILGPNHPHINVSDCFEAIRIYSALVLKWKEIQDRREQLIKAAESSNNAGGYSGGMLMIESKPTFEEETLKALEGRIISVPQAPPPIEQIEIGGGDGGVDSPGNVLAAAAARAEKKKRKKRKEKKKKKRKKKDQDGQEVFRPSAVDDRLNDSLVVEQPQEDEEAEVSVTSPPGSSSRLDLDSLMADTAQGVLDDTLTTTTTSPSDMAMMMSPSTPNVTPTATATTPTRRKVEEPPSSGEHEPLSSASAPTTPWKPDMSNQNDPLPPSSVSAPTTPSKAELQKRVQVQTQKAIQASELQTKMRGTFMDRLRRVKLTPTRPGSGEDDDASKSKKKEAKKKKKYRHSTGSMPMSNNLNEGDAPSGTAGTGGTGIAGVDSPPPIRRKSLWTKVMGTK